MDFEKLTQIIADVLSVDPHEITENTTFLEDLGADSLDVYQMVMNLENQFHISITYEAIKNVKTVGEALKYLAKLKMDGMGMI
jgi:acyl carrier protein